MGWLSFASGISSVVLLLFKNRDFPIAPCVPFLLIPAATGSLGVAGFLIIILLLNSETYPKVYQPGAQMNVATCNCSLRATDRFK